MKIASQITGLFAIALGVLGVKSFDSSHQSKDAQIFEELLSRVSASDFEEVAKISAIKVGDSPNGS